MLRNGTSVKLMDNNRKELEAFFNDLRLSMAADINSHTVNFLYIAQNLQEGKFVP